MPRFYLPLTLFAAQNLELPENIVRHLHVLRLAIGEEVILFNGKGGEYRAVLQSLEKRSASVQVLDHLAVERESPLSITLVQAVSSADRMDFTLQKAVELGVQVIQPLFTARSAPIPADRREKRHLHWQNILIAACEQCGRNQIPTLGALQTLPTWLATQPNQTDLKLVLAPDASQGLKELATPSTGQNIQLFIGAEGGLSEAELGLLSEYDWQKIRLGGRILRTETAGLATLAALQMQWGDF